jgi:hypothetical protein
MSKWLSSVPENCEVCKRKLEGQFVDGRTVWGPWAIQCTTCFNDAKFGYGIGKGQLYDLKTRECLQGGRGMK